MFKYIKYFFYLPISPLVVKFLFSFLYKKNDNICSINKTILILKIDEIGDFVLFTAFLRELKKNYSDYKITLVIKKELFNLAETCPYVDHVETFKLPNKIKLIYKYQLFLRSFLFAKNKLWKYNFDLSIIPRWDIDTSFSSYISFFSKAKIRIAYSEKATSLKKYHNKDYDLLMTQILESNLVMHEVNLNLQILKELGCNIESSNLEIWLNRLDEDFADINLKTKKDELIIAIVPGALNKNRQWPIENYIKICSYLSSVHDVKIILLGGKAEIILAKKITDNLNNIEILNFVGLTTLRQTAALLKKCYLFIGNDTGLKHLAASVGTKVLEISRFHLNGYKMHNQSPFRFHAWGVENYILQPEFPINNCNDDCLYDFPHCIKSVTVEDVINVLKSKFSSLTLIKNI